MSDERRVRPMTDECATKCGRPVWKWRLCRECLMPLAGACLGKSRIGPGWAKQAHPGCVIYDCLVCGHRHVGAVAGHSAERDEAVTAVIQALKSRGNGWILKQLADGWRFMDRTAWKTGQRLSA
jgi:hypothetical protein